MQSEKFIIIQGSSNSHGNTRKIVDYILSRKEGNFIDLNTKNIGYFDYEHKNSDDDFLGVIDSVLECDTIIFATPVYWYSMSASMKTFIDRISDLMKIRKDMGRKLEGKKMIIISCGSDGTEFPSVSEPFKLSADYLNMTYLGNVHTWLDADSISETVQQSLDILISKLK